MPYQDNFILRSDVVQELIEKPPRWIIRWGLTVIFFIVALIILCSILVKVPEYVSATCEVKVIGQKDLIRAKGDGHIKTLFETGEHVTKGTKLLETERYAIHSPNDGFLYMQDPLYPSMPIQRDDTLLYVLNDKSQLLVNIDIPKKYYDKVNKGQMVTFSHGDKIFNNSLLSLANVAEDDVYQGVALIPISELTGNSSMLKAILNSKEVKILVNEKSLFAGLL